MTKDEATVRSAMKLALEALELHGQQYPHMVKGYCLDAITALREALAQERSSDEQLAQRKPLTDEEIKELYGDDDNFRMTEKYVVAFARAIEAAHGIKENRNDPET